MIVVVTGGFNISGATASRGIAENNAYQLGEDLTLVRGRHQIAVGANVTYWHLACVDVGSRPRHMELHDGGVASASRIPAPGPRGGAGTVGAMRAV